MNRDLATLPIYLVGCGSLGSAIALLLCKAGARALHLYDDQIVEPKNIDNQLYCPFHVGVHKVEALWCLLEALTGTRAHVSPRRVSCVPAAGGVVISAVDNMQSRRALYATFRADLLVDPRVGGSVLRVHFVRQSDPEGRSLYESTLYSDQEAVTDPCLSAATVHTCWSAAALVVSGVVRWLGGVMPNREIIFDHTTLICSSQ